MNKRDDKCEVINLGNDTYIIKGWVVGPEVEIEELALKVAKIVKISNHSMA
ncbi:hypothetical protein BMR1_03g01565 [Babesia microti strain RI]|uniref:Uncharacterized protein n=1 Tax=Babesia microti (strain RI) TaxID=1133968 RepID=A0A0K3AN23_BABMR|nr:hypothetical protein BMR1_03g01565 [Babesia microti strain RI]CTQ40912.1 hypothetical protein BMR1_03g01565 [Babesia microti strain RI]|eukprot:XP_012648923.1 hypothetical protein BMR1_03g01565 [Babesia microti strain RI]